MEHTIELRIPSMLRVLADLGRLQVTRLVAQTLFDLRHSGEDDNDRNWFDAEKINNSKFWDDLMGIITRDDPAGTERVVRHIFYYRQELSRVIAIPSTPLASVVVSLEQPEAQRLSAGAKVVSDVSLVLRPVTIKLGLETGRSILAPASFQAVVVDLELTGVSDLAYEPLEADVLRVAWEQERYDSLNIGTASAETRAPASGRRIVVEAGSCSPGTFLVHFSADLILTSTLEPVTEYPLVPDTFARNEEVRVTSNHAARIRVL